MKAACPNTQSSNIIRQKRKYKHQSTAQDEAVFWFWYSTVANDDGDGDDDNDNDGDDDDSDSVSNDYKKSLKLKSQILIVAQFKIVIGIVLHFFFLKFVCVKSLIAGWY